MGCALCHAGVTVGARLGRYAGALAGGSRALLVCALGAVPRAAGVCARRRVETRAACRGPQPVRTATGWSAARGGGVRAAPAAPLRRVRRGPSSD